MTRLEDAVDILSAARVTVSNDSGLMHVAAAAGLTCGYLWFEFAGVYAAADESKNNALSETLNVVPASVAIVR